MENGIPLNFNGNIQAPLWCPPFLESTPTSTQRDSCLSDIKRNIIGQGEEQISSTL